VIDKLLILAMKVLPGQLSLPLFELDPDERPQAHIPRETNLPHPRPGVVSSRSETQRPVEAAVNGKTAPAPTLLTTSEAAELLHIHPRTVQRLVERGELSAVHLGSAVRFEPLDLAGLITRLKRRREAAASALVDSVRARSGARVSFADRLRSQQHEHRAAQA